MNLLVEVHVEEARGLVDEEEPEDEPLGLLGRLHRHPDLPVLDLQLHQPVAVPD